MAISHLSKFKEVFTLELFEKVKNRSIPIGDTPYPIVPLSPDFAEYVLNATEDTLLEAWRMCTGDDGGVAQKITTTKLIATGDRGREWSVHFEIFSKPISYGVTLPIR